MQCEIKQKNKDKSRFFCAYKNAWIYHSFCVDMACERMVGGVGDLPPLAEQIKSVASAALQQIAAGNPQRTPEEVERLKAICEECEWYMPDKIRCRKCGCYLNVKRRWATASCPLGKW